MPFLDVSSLKPISKIDQIMKMIMRADCSNKIKTKIGLLQITIIRYTYVQAVKKDIEQSKTVIPRKIRLSLSKDEKVPLKDQSKRDDIFITKADKGGAVVIMGINYFIREVKRQLNDLKNYKVLAKDPTTTNNNLVN